MRSFFVLPTSTSTHSPRRHLCCQPCVSMSSQALRNYWVLIARSSAMQLAQICHQLCTLMQGTQFIHVHTVTVTATATATTDHLSRNGASITPACDESSGTSHHDGALFQRRRRRSLSSPTVPAGRHLATPGRSHNTAGTGRTGRVDGGGRRRSPSACEFKAYEG